jgi:hypothetical protein
MGGIGRLAVRLRSVEAFILGGYSWGYLPAMNDITEKCRHRNCFTKEKLSVNYIGGNFCQK